MLVKGAPAALSGGNSLVQRLRSGTARFALMMTSSNGNIFCVTGPLLGEFIGEDGRWIPLINASDAELWCSLICARTNVWVKQSTRWWFETSSRSLWSTSFVIACQMHVSSNNSGSPLSGLNTLYNCIPRWLASFCSPNTILSSSSHFWAPFWQTTTFSNAFSWMKSYVFWLKFH